MWLPYFGNEYFPEHYAETHPEYYRFNADGSRFQPKSSEDHTGQWVYCSRNTDCIETVAANLNRWIDENPLVDVIAFRPMTILRESWLIWRFILTAFSLNRNNSRNLM